MPSLSRLTFLAVVTAVLGFTPGASGQQASPWIEGHRSRVRLVAGGTERGVQLAGVQIELAPGFKTYWRNPGESGLPPTFDWSKSQNVAEAEVLWPAPRRFEDAAGVTYGYADAVLFPLRVRLRDPGKPATLAGKLDYGVCKDICIPAQADLSLPLGNAGSAPGGAIEAALKRVPKPQPLGAPGDLSVLDARIVSGEKAKLTVIIRAPSGTQPDLFVEAPDKWFFQPTSTPPQTTPGQDPSRTFSVDIVERPKEGGKVDLRLTLVAGDRAIETAASLDAAPVER